MIRGGNQLTRVNIPGTVVWLLLCLYLGPGPLCAQESLASSSGDSGYAGRSLQNALLDLRTRGLRIVFTSNVVLPQMKVDVEPRAEDLRALLVELLRPHGLIAVDGPSNTVVVVPRPHGYSEPTSSIVGTVHSRTDATAVAGVNIRVLESGLEVSIGGDGHFLIPNAPSHSPPTGLARAPRTGLEASHDGPLGVVG